MMEPDDEMEESGPRFPPPSQEQVAWRALCLYAVSVRADCEYVHQLAVEYARHLEGDPKPPPELAPLTALEEWISVQGIRERLSPIEREWFATPLGEWEQQQVLDGTWRKESLGVLLWALSVLDALPPYDTEFPEKVHTGNIGWLQPASSFLDRVRLRQHDEIAHARDLAELWNWRARTRQLQEMDPNTRSVPRDFNFEKIIRQAAEIAHQRGDIPRPIKRDFPAFRKPYARLTRDEYSLATSIAMERHFALNWLCGYAEDWDSTPTDT